MTTPSLEALVDGLHHLPTATVTQAPFLRHGSTAFDVVAKGLSQDVGVLYKLNALHVLYGLSREACPHRFPDLFTLCDSLIHDENIKVRSYALVLAIRVLDLDVHGLLPTELKSDTTQFIGKTRQAFLQGVTTEVQSVVKGFLDTH